MKQKSWLIFWLAAIVLLFGFNGSLLITDSVEANYALTAKEGYVRRLAVAADLRTVLV